MNKEQAKIYVFLDDRDRDLPAITKYEFNQEEFTEINKHGYGIFQSVNSFDLTKPLLPGEKTFRCESHLSKLDYVYADLDIGKRGDGQTDEQKKIKKEAKLQEVLPFKPTMVMETANGIQPYWKIADGGVTTESKLKCENIICSIIDKFNGDPGAKDLSRILRMPDFYHNKGAPFLCKIIHKEDIEYTLDGLLQLFPFTAKTNETIKNKTDFWEALKQGFPEGNRHSAFLSLCLSMLKGKYEKDFDNVWLVMESTYHQNVKDTNGFSLNDAKICFRQACKYAKDWDKGIITSEHKIISLNDILKLIPKQNPFLLQGMIVEGSVNALTSDSGKGKSLLMLKMVEAIAQGEKFLEEFETKKSKVLIVDLEMSEDDVIGRTQSIIGHEIEGIDFHHSQSFNILNDDDFKWLKNTVLANGYKLVVLDTYSMAAGSKNENDNAEANLVNKRFLELTNECGCTILFLHHHRKLQKGEVMSQSTSRGATDIIGKTASHLLIDTKDIIVMDGEDAQKGIKIVVEQMKRRRATGFDRFAVNIWYNPIKDKSYFSFAGYDEKAATAIEKVIALLMDKMEVGEEYLMSDITDMVGKTSVLYTALKQLVEVDKKIGIRLPQEGEERNGAKIRHNAKIYYKEA
jgi:hypothetical protein